MNCSEAEVLIHALLDNELDAGHAREVEEHVAGCADCRHIKLLGTLLEATGSADGCCDPAGFHASPRPLRKRKQINDFLPPRAVVGPISTLNLCRARQILPGYSCARCPVPHAMLGEP